PGAWRDRDLLHADLSVGLEPPLSHARLLPDRPAVGRQRRLSDHARGGAPARPEGDAGWRIQPRQPRLLPVQRYSREWPTLSLAGLVYDLGLAAEPLRRRQAGQLRGLGRQSRAAEAKHRQSPSARVYYAGGRALAARRDRRLAAGCAVRDRDPWILAGVSAARQGDQPGCLYRRRDLA